MLLVFYFCALKVLVELRIFFQLKSIIMNTCHCKKNNSITYQYPGITIVKKSIPKINIVININCLFNIINTVIP